MTDHTSNDLTRDRLTLVELAAPWLVRAAEAAVVVLLVLVVCPPLMILLVVVAVPLVALAALFTIVASVFAIPYFLATHLRRRRPQHTRIVVSRLKRLRPIR
jgi:hypothetical protein